MINKLKEIGKGTIYEFSKYRLETLLPSRNRNSESYSEKVINNEWYDKGGNHYKLLDNVLFITANDYFPESEFSIVEYINQLPKECTIVLKIKSKPNNVAGYNMLFNRLSVFPINKNVIIDISKLSFSEKIALDIEKIPTNVKITSLLNGTIEEKEEFSNESFESWALNCNDKTFELLLTKLTFKTLERISKMREIAFNFYRYMPVKLKNGTNDEKIQFAYEWCCNNIGYDWTAIKSDNSLKWDRKDSQDPIFTFNRRKGVCEGRARLLKLLLNNYYMRVPCFLVKGISGNLQHTWNEAILEDGNIIDMDISKQINRVAWNHDELLYFNDGKKIQSTKQM